MSLGKLFWRTKKGERWVESLKHLKLPYSPYPPYWPYELIPLKPSTPSYMKKCIDYRVRCVHLISWTSYLFQTCYVICFPHIFYIQQTKRFLELNLNSFWEKYLFLLRILWGQGCCVLFFFVKNDRLGVLKYISTFSYLLVLIILLLQSV